MPRQDIQQAIGESIERIRTSDSRRPIVGIILGSGLGGLAERIEQRNSIPYSEIPGFVKSTAAGHRGQLILGKIEECPIVAMAGRMHRYEGHSHDEVAYPVQVMASLGASVLIVSNAAGGLNPRLSVGDIVVISDHLDFMRGYPQVSVDFSSDVPLRRKAVYDSEMSELAMRVAMEKGFTAYRGTYLATLGPNYESRAECRMMRQMGADVVGMSTVPEVLTACNLGMRILGLSMVSNVATPDCPKVATHQEVLAAGKAAESKMESIVRAVLRMPN